MSIRVSGLISGMDTDSMVKELVAAYGTKKNKYVKSQKKLEWRMDAWKDMNKKVNSFYKKLGNLKLSTAYSKKTTSCSDTTKATVTASNNASNGSQSLEIEELAKAAFITGAKLGNSVTGNTTLRELGLTGEGTIAVTTKGSTKNITVKENMTVKEFVGELKGAGITANFDDANHRLYVSAKDSGLENNFALTATDAKGVSVLQSLGVYVDTTANTDAYRQWTDYAIYNADGTIDQAATETKLADILETIRMHQSDATENSMIYGTTINERNPDGTVKDRDKSSIKFLQEDSVNRRTENTNHLADINYANSFYELKESLKYGTPIQDADGNTIGWNSNLTGGEQSELENFLTRQDGLTEDEQTRLNELKEKLVGTGPDAELAWKGIEGYASAVKDYEKEPANAGKVSEVNAAYATDGQAGIQAYVDIYVDKINKNNNEINANSAAIADKNTYISQNALLSGAAPDSDTNTIADRVSILMDKIHFADQQLASPSGFSGATIVAAQDAKVKLNDEEYTFSSNSFTINGMSITALQKTNGQPLTITTQSNVQGMYDTVKGFLKEYNTLIKEMDVLYNAPSAKGYEPLTDEDKESLSDKEVEKWEEKIKDSILRRDDRLSTVMGVMTSSMTKGFTLSDGKKYSLASFGIKTSTYMSAEENEGSLLHIDGDQDDELTSSKPDQLLDAIQKDPEMVQEFFQTLTGNLYEELDGRMRSSTLSHSVYTIYNDKTMQKEYDDYSKTIKKWEQKVSDMEDFYYKKFTAMETALSKLQQSTSALSGLLGSGS